MALSQRLSQGSTVRAVSMAWPVQQQRACAWRGASQGCRRRQRAVTAALPEFFKDFFDFATWAPKSSRVWRLQQWEPGTDNSPTEADRIEADSMQTLNERISQLRDQGSDASSSSSGSNGSSSSSRGSEGGSVATLDPGSSALGPAERSFSEMGDADIAEALASRLRGAGLVTAGSSAGAAAERSKPLTGEEIRQLLLTKYGKSYDISFVRRDMPGKTFVSMNIMWLHLEQRSFKMTPEQYMEKLNSVAALVAVLGQTDKVRAFLKAPARSQKGLPRRPVVGTAISIQFDLPQAVIEEWWGTRGGL